MMEVENYCSVTGCNLNVAFRFPARPSAWQEVQMPSSHICHLKHPGRLTLLRSSSCRAPSRKASNASQADADIYWVPPG